MTDYLTRALLVAAVAAVCAGGCVAEPGDSSFFCSIYADHRATAVGDIVLVVVSESALASHSATHGNDKSSATTVGPGMGLLDFIPLMGYSGQGKSQATGSSQRRDLLTARIAAVVTGITPAGNLIIEGERRVACNRDFQTIRLRGEVRPCDVGPGNTVLSQHVANAEIAYNGPDPARPGGRVGIIPRILGWLF